MSKAGCEAYQERDGTHYCGRCGLRWDNDDKDPPECLGVVVRDVKTKVTNSKIFNTDTLGIRARPAVSKEEQKEINRRGMALLRETL